MVTGYWPISLYILYIDRPMCDSPASRTL